MLTVTYLSRAADPAGVIAMTFRVYVRWPGQQVTDKTSTESRAVAEAAYSELVKSAATFRTKGALGITLTENGRQLQYEELSAEISGGAERKGR
jgi:hypothetical protein